MFAVLDDLEQQASGLHLAERDAEVAGLRAAEYSTVSVAARLHASVGSQLRVRLVGGHVIGGRLARVGEGWLLLVDAAGEWLVRHEGITSVDGLSTRARTEETWSVLDRLSLRSVLRRLSEAGDSCLVHFLDDQRVEGRVGRVGRDFFELLGGAGHDRSMQSVPGVQVVRTAAVSAIQGRAG